MQLPGKLEMMARYERELISSLLEQNHFNLAKTSDQLKISRHALRYRMQRLNIAEPAENEQEPAASATRCPRCRKRSSVIRIRRSS
jgi:predicted ArsR family transcriptional regulator